MFDVGQEATGVIAIGQVATGVIAIGQVATGVIAIGQLARGVIAVGQLSLGVVTVGQLAAGALWSAGGGIGATSGPGFVVGLFGRFRLRPAAGQQRWRPARRSPWRFALAVVVWLVVAAVVVRVALAPIPDILAGTPSGLHEDAPTTTTTTGLR